MRSIWMMMLASVVVSITPPAAAVAQTITSERAAQIDRLFDHWNRRDSPGCALSVMQGGHIVYEHGYGMADLEHDAPITPATPFHVASVSKQFTAASVVLLAEQGRLSFDDDVRKYVPELPDFGTRITLRHLLHHTSGLRDQWDLLELAGWRYSLDLITNQDVLDVLVRQKELNFRPGDRFLYSNTGYTLLGEVVKRVSGKSLRDFTDGVLFQPLGMSHSHFRDDHAELIKGQAYAYVPDKAKGWRLSITNFDTVGATSLFTTVEDLARWDENFYDHKVGGPRFASDMTQRDPLSSGETPAYAFGLLINTYRGLPVVEHAGGDAGYRSYLLRFPDQHFSVACLCNAGPQASPGELVHKVADLFLATQYKQPASLPDVQALELKPERLSQFAGFYWNSSTDDVVTITVKGKELMVRHGSAPLHAVSEGVFKTQDSLTEYRFFRADTRERARVQIINALQSSTLELLPPFTAPATLDEYVGDYVSDEIDPIYHVRIQTGKLVITRLKNEPEVLEQWTRDLFVGDTGAWRFLRNSNGSISGMLLSTGRIRGLRFQKEPVRAINSDGH